MNLYPSLIEIETPQTKLKMTYDEIIFRHYKEYKSFIIYNKQTNSETSIIDKSSSNYPPIEDASHNDPPIEDASYNDPIILNTPIMIDTTDNNIHISINRFSTIFSIDLLINNIVVIIYKKIYHNKNNLLHSITNNYIKHKPKAIDSICKIAEFIYENKDFIENLAKIKQIIMINAIWKSQHRVLEVYNQNKIFININELFKLKQFKELSKQESPDYINLYDIKKNQIRKYSEFFFTSKLTNITDIYKNQQSVNSHYISIESIINKQNFDIVKTLHIINDINPNLLNNKYVTNTKNGFLISDKYYNKLYNNNQKLNYYYGQKFTNAELTIFDQNPDPFTYSKITYHNQSIHKYTILKNKSLITIQSYQDNIKLLVKMNVDNYNQNQQLIELNTLIKNINIANDIFNKIKWPNNNISFVSFLRYLFIPKWFKLNKSLKEIDQYNDHNFTKTIIFIKPNKLTKITRAIDNIIYNTTTNQFEGLKYIKSVLNPLIISNNDLLFKQFILNVFMSKNSIFPFRFHRIKRLPNDECKYIVLTEIVDITYNENMVISNLNKSANFDLETFYNLMILMNRKYTQEKILKIKNQWKLIQLKSI